MGEGRDGDETGQTARGSPPGLKGGVVTPKACGRGFAALLSTFLVTLTPWPLLGTPSFLSPFLPVSVTASEADTSLLAVLRLV